MGSIELKNLDDSSEDITSETTYNENENNVCVEIISNEKQKIKEHYVRKVGGGGPDEPKFIPMLLTFISVLFFTVLNECVATVMYTDLVDEFNKELTTIQWVTTGFVLVLAIGMVFSSYIAKHLYMRTIFFSAVLLFVVGSLICVLANSFVLLLIGRIIQGFGTALLMPQISNVIIIMSPRERIGFYNGISMLVIITGSALGPTVSGLITKFLGWRYVFALLIPIPTIGGICGYWTVGNIVEQDTTKLDILSVILAILGYGGISFGLGNTGDYGFGSPVVIITIAIGVVSLIGFFVWEYYCKNPIVSLKGLGKPIFIINVLLSNIISSSLVGWLAVLPFIIQNYLGKSSFISGLALLPGGILNATLNIVGGKIYDKSYFKYGPGGMFLLFFASIFFFVMHITDRIQLWVIIVGYALGNIGIPLVASLYSTASLTCVPPQSTPHAAAIFHSFYQLFCALCSAVYVALLNNFDNVSFNSSKDPLVNGGSICFLLTIFVSALCLLVAIPWSIIFFRNHDNQGNPKQSSIKS
ncbi:MFS general substrate transporter [Neocallimastix californiae]|jgi:DHA2 family lincomycin resistance protein-like MFS transporter|uniref:MFS general substrate transporter n=1 Tax=Neocallimastix californiae TaxID=1754190 RepID=A0A1Y1ZUV1_9FUNG|nr:MFS general substrate transporter [Neocallimastix californiae]|eukprot:ORY13555.1 MFS general substrate transporter [Neocallimastix californiae]